MSLILKHLVSFIYAIFAGISAPLSSFNIKVFLFFGVFLEEFWYKSILACKLILEKAVKVTNKQNEQEIKCNY